MKSLKTRRLVGDIVIYVILSIMAIIWLLPIIWLVLQSFATSIGARSRLIPTSFSLEAYTALFTGNHSGSVHTYDGMFFIWFKNTLIVAVLSCIISTLFVLGTAYALSRFRFKGRDLFMRTNLVIGMFPGFLGMIILFWVMKEIFHLQGSYWALVIIYSAGAGGGYYISKGFFDTISKSIDEAAEIDGANKAQIFFQIILPLAKPIVIYTILTSFMGPWGEYVTSSYIIGLQNVENWTVAIGLYKFMSDNDLMMSYYTQFAAGAVVVAIPITVLFFALQKYYVSGVTGGAVKG
ncbi:MAG: sugar ABC transporter permease [Erysipelotrichaceae bacterium]|nr:sugar ABC transporter permease [Erysipelotrichaceae bacterium]